MRTKDRPSIPDVIGRFQAYHAGNPVWGSLHIVLEDGNVRDEDVEFCRLDAERVGDTEGVELAKILTVMSRTQRRKLGGAIR